MFDIATRGVIRQTAGGCAPGMSTVSFSSSGGVTVGGGITVVNYTVPAGKTLYITDVDVSTDSTTAVLMQMLAGALVIAEKYISTTRPFEFVGIESQMTVPSGALFKLVFPAVTTHIAYVVNGYLQ